MFLGKPLALLVCLRQGEHSPERHPVSPGSDLERHALPDCPKDCLVARSLPVAHAQFKRCA
jgi:hypothetical protein